MTGVNPERKALASVSLGHRQATFLSTPLSVWLIRSHMWMNRSVNSFMPKKNIVVYLNDWPGLSPRPKNHASHGTIVETLGMPLASHASATGLAVSGVAEASTMSTLSVKMRSRVTAAARVESDWLSLTTISIE